MEHDTLYRFDTLSLKPLEMKKRTNAIRDFDTTLEASISPVDKNEAPRSTENKIASLDKQSENLESYTSAQLMSLCMAYRDLGAFDKMIDLYERAPNKDFTQATSVREQIAYAYLRKENKEQLYRYDVDQSNNSKIMALLYSEISKGEASPFSYEVLGRCYRNLAEKAPNYKIADHYLNRATQTFEKSFAETKDPSVGIHVVLFNMENLKEKRAHEEAKVVLLAALRDGVLESDNFQKVADALILAGIAGGPKDLVGKLYEQLNKTNPHPREVTETVKKLKRIPPDFTLSPLPEIKNVLSKKISGQKDAVPQMSTTPLSPEEKAVSAIRKSTYSYRGLATPFDGAHRINGNFSFGSQLPDQVISRHDLKLFTDLLNYTPLGLGLTEDEVKSIRPAADKNIPLAKIEDPELFAAVADKFIRKTFMTENFGGTGLHLEDNALSKDETGSSVYDKTVKAAIHASGKLLKEDRDTPYDAKMRKKTDSKTNISAIFALGMGDCRHHAQVKQIMFDMWQKKQMDKSIGKLFEDACQEKHILLDNKEIQKFNEVFNVEMRTADVRVVIPIKMNQKMNDKGTIADVMYSPKLNNGKFVPSDKSAVLEEHTMCYLVRPNSVKLCDAFYQDKHYNWENKDVPLDQVTYTELGQPILPAGYVSKDKTTGGKDLPVTLQPTVYAGKRDKVCTNTTGKEISFIGIPMSGFSSVKGFLEMIKNRKEMSSTMQKMRSHNSAILSILLKDKPPKENNDPQKAIKDVKKLRYVRNSGGKGM